MVDSFDACMQKLFPMQRRLCGDHAQVSFMADMLGNPQKSFPAIHVTGSNGKGSVCHKIAKALTLSGYKVGLFTSPHIHCFTERIMISERPIAKEEVVAGLQGLFSLAEQNGFSLSAFAFTTLLAMQYFQKEKVDVAVIEVGIGGRLDATSIVSSILSIITSVSLEHTELLGSTIEKIAKEKAGIFRPGVPALLGYTAQISSAIDHAKDIAADLFLCKKIDGSFDDENSHIAEEGLSLLKKHFPQLKDSHIKPALLSRPACRKEIIGRFIFDVAHNRDAIEKLFSSVRLIYPSENIDVILGMSEDKDIESCLAVICRHARLIYLTSAKTKRSARPEYLEALLSRNTLASYIKVSSVAKAVNLASENSDSIVVVCGSFYIMDEAKNALLQKTVLR